jgi:hypothetical protein
MKSFESLSVIVPSKSVKKMNFGLVFMAGRVVEPILEDDGGAIFYVVSVAHFRGLFTSRKQE